MGTANLWGSAPPKKKTIGVIKIISGTNNYAGKGSPDLGREWGHITYYFKF